MIEPGPLGDAQVVRLFASDDTLWVLVVETWTGPTDSPDVRRFLDSFKVTG